MPSAKHSAGTIIAYRSSRFVVMILAICLTQTSCRSKAPEIKDKVALTKVTGKVLVNGEPAGGVLIRYRPSSDVGEKRPEYASFFVHSREDGTFALRTYVQGDGIPAGNYKLFFQYFPLTQKEARQMGDGDRLGGKYSDPKAPPKVVEVKEGNPVDLGTIELKTIAKAKTS